MCQVRIWLFVLGVLGGAVVGPVDAARTLTIPAPIQRVSNFPEQTDVVVQPSLILDSDGGVIQTIRCKIIQGLNVSDSLRVTTGNVAPNNSSNFTQSYSSATGILTITDPTPTSAEGVSGGTWEALLRTLTLKIALAKNSQNNVRLVEFEILEQNKSFLHPDGTYHFYDYVAKVPNVTWSAANADVSNYKWYGKTGYLTTVTSSDENTFVLGQVAVGLTGWLGGSDNGVTGNNTWSWNTGPETGIQYSNGNASVNGSYVNWQTGEPNHDTAAPNANYMQIYTNAGSAGKWNDLSNLASIGGYFVEWGGLKEAGTIVEVKVQHRNSIKHGAGF